MNILYNSIYKHDLKKPEKFKSLDQDIECEIAIIGGGFTGLSSAIELAEAGLSVCVFEKNILVSGHQEEMEATFHRVGQLTFQNKEKHK